MGTEPSKASVGYEDTPFLPNSSYRVHDGTRPQPRIVDPGMPTSAAGSGRAPTDAVVLFDGTDLSDWIGNEGAPAPWRVENGYMEVLPRSGNIRTREDFGDCQLHVEFCCPAEVRGDSQGRGNSGVFLMARYEIQVLDCYENPTYPDGTTGAIYGQCPPLVNACRPPGHWQTYDIIWIGPRFTNGAVTRPARVTVLLNGVLLHHDREIIGGTTHKNLPVYEEHPPAGPLMLQDHGDLVRFRNIWYRPLRGYDE